MSLKGWPQGRPFLLAMLSDLAIAKLADVRMSRMLAGWQTIRMIHRAGIGTLGICSVYHCDRTTP
jgi:thiosulfate reductase cytochrome b subunit